MELNLDTAKYFTDIIIGNMEGGYYHPKMKEYLVNGERLGNSGETMYGIDFKAGGALGETQFAQEVKQFFAPYVEEIHDNATAFRIYSDKADGKKVAPAELGQRWRPMVAEMMLNLFRQYVTKLDPGAREVVMNDPALFLQFFYGVWNGKPAFDKFAEVMNKAYGEGERDPQNLNRVVQDCRYATRPRWSAEQVDRVTSQMYGTPNYPDTITTDNNDNNSRGLIPLLILGGVAIYLIFKNR